MMYFWSTKIMLRKNNRLYRCCRYLRVRTNTGVVKNLDISAFSKAGNDGLTILITGISNGSKEIILAFGCNICSDIVQTATQAHNAASGIGS